MADFTDVTANRFQEDLRRAAGYKPIIREDLEKAYARYKSVGVKFGQINKLPKSSQTDKALFKKATNDVIKWYKANKKPAAPKPRPAPATGARISRTQAATIARQMGLDPADIFGYGTTNPASSYWINNPSASYLWQSQSNFEGWLRRTYGK